MPGRFKKPHFKTVHILDSEGPAVHHSTRYGVINGCYDHDVPEYRPFIKRKRFTAQQYS